MDPGVATAPAHSLHPICSPPPPQVTPAVFSDMKRQLKQREDGGWARVQWDIARVRPSLVWNFNFTCPRT